MSRTTRGLGAMRPEQANRDQPEAQQGGSGCGCFLTILVIVGAVIGVSFAAERYDFPGADLFRTTNSKAEQWYWQVGQFLFDNEAEPTLADGSVTTPTPPPPTAAPIVIRATATPAPTLTRSGPVSSVSTAASTDLCRAPPLYTGAGTYLYVQANRNAVAFAHANPLAYAYARMASAYATRVSRIETVNAGTHQHRTGQARRAAG